MPFHIINESTEKRYLTGSDFDPESFQFADDALWIGEEFGPYLIKADLNGKVLAVFDTGGRQSSEIAGQPDAAWGRRTASRTSGGALQRL